MIPTYIAVSDETDHIRVDVILVDEEDEQSGDSENILTLSVTPYLEGKEARSIAERVATLASINMADDDGKPINWGTNY